MKKDKTYYCDICGADLGIDSTEINKVSFKGWEENGKTKTYQLCDDHYGNLESLIVDMKQSPYD